jgi:uncharacterized protein YuzE
MQLNIEAKVTYDTNVNALYIKLNGADEKYTSTKPISDTIMLDFVGIQVAGIEILDFIKKEKKK